MKKIILGFLSVSMIIGIWFIFSYKINNNYILPNPILVFQTFIELIQSLKTYSIILASMGRLVIALLLSTLSGISFGLLGGNYMAVDDFLKPIISGLRSLPIASIIIVLMIILGREQSLFVITFLMIFPIIYEAVKLSIHQIDQDINDQLSLEQISFFRLVTQIQLPLSIPLIRSSIHQSVGIGFKVMVMAEFITQTNQGIGRELFNGTISINYATVFAWTLLIILLVMMIEHLILNQLKIS